MYYKGLSQDSIFYKRAGVQECSIPAFDSELSIERVIIELNKAYEMAVEDTKEGLIKELVAILNDNTAKDLILMIVSEAQKIKNV